jgi:protein-disulfide isomerase
MNKTVFLFILSIFFLAACTTNTGDTNPRTLGNANAKILIEEFSDPECPACGVVSPQVEQIVRENPDLARLEYYHFPLSYHKNAFIASEASECAGDQGKFFEYLDTIYANQSSLSEDYLYDVADSLSLDRAAFDSCLENHDYKAKILAQMAEGKRRQLPGTPTLFVNGQMVRYSDAETFKAYLESL